MRNMAARSPNAARVPKSLQVFLLGAGLAVLIGVAVSFSAFLTVAVVGLAIWGAFIAANSHRLSTVFLGSLGVLLVGYAFLGRSFAHFGVAPLYVGEAVLSFTLVAFIASLRTARWGFLEITLASFMVLGAFRTIPYVSLHGMDAFRDSVLWAYAIITLTIAFTLQREHVDAIVKRYTRILPWFVVWVPIAFALLLTVGGSVPTTPGSDVPLIWPKGGDMGVHLAGVAAFVMVGLYARMTGKSSGRELPLWPFWIAGVVAVGIINRGGFLSLSIALLVTFLLRPTGRILTPIVFGMTLLACLLLVNPSVELGEREVSATQMMENVTSIFSSPGEGGLEGTRQWRLRWWGDIIGYTFNGEYRWTGKGYGVNLADVDGYQANDDGSIRSPHNGHMTVLARMGVPGIMLWIVFQAGFAIAMLKAVFRARGNGQLFWTQVNIWILAIWIAMMINTSFDVYLEGPQGGIWFWSVIGFGLAAIRIQRTSPEEPELETINPGQYSGSLTR